MDCLKAREPPLKVERKGKSRLSGNPTGKWRSLCLKPRVEAGSERTLRLLLHRPQQMRNRRRPRIRPALGPTLRLKRLPTPNPDSGQRTFAVPEKAKESLIRCKPFPIARET